MKRRSFLASLVAVAAAQFLPWVLSIVPPEKCDSVVERLPTLFSIDRYAQQVVGHDVVATLFGDWEYYRNTDNIFCGKSARLTKDLECFLRSINQEPSSYTLPPVLGAEPLWPISPRYRQVNRRTS